MPLLTLSGGVGHAVAKANVFIPGCAFLGASFNGDPVEVVAIGRVMLNKLDGAGFFQQVTDDDFEPPNTARTPTPTLTLTSLTRHLTPTPTLTQHLPDLAGNG